MIYSLSVQHEIAHGHGQGSLALTVSEGARGDSTGGISTAGLLEPDLYAARRLS